LPVTVEEIPGANHFSIMDELVSPTGRITTLIRQLFERSKSRRPGEGRDP
jgi:arylformamidase